MVMSTCGGGSGSGSGSGVGIEPMDEQMRDFISSEITRNILEQTPVIIGSVKEGIMKIFDECLGTFRREILAIVGLSLFPSAIFVLVELRSSLGRRTPFLVGVG